MDPDRRLDHTSDSEQDRREPMNDRKSEASIQFERDQRARLALTHKENLESVMRCAAERKSRGAGAGAPAAAESGSKQKKKGDRRDTAQREASGSPLWSQPSPQRVHRAEGGGPAPAGVSNNADATHHAGVNAGRRGVGADVRATCGNPFTPQGARNTIAADADAARPLADGSSYPQASRLLDAAEKLRNALYMPATTVKELTTLYLDGSEVEWTQLRQWLQSRSAASPPCFVNIRKERGAGRTVTDVAEIVEPLGPPYLPPTYMVARKPLPHSDPSDAGTRERIVSEFPYYFEWQRVVADHDGSPLNVFAPQADNRFTPVDPATWVWPEDLRAVRWTKERLEAMKEAAKTERAPIVLKDYRLPPPVERITTVRMDGDDEGGVDATVNAIIAEEEQLSRDLLQEMQHAIDRLSDAKEDERKAKHALSVVHNRKLAEVESGATDRVLRPKLTEALRRCVAKRQQVREEEIAAIDEALRDLASGALAPDAERYTVTKMYRERSEPAANGNALATDAVVAARRSVGADSHASRMTSESSPAPDRPNEHPLQASGSTASQASPVRIPPGSTVLQDLFAVSRGPLDNVGNGKVPAPAGADGAASAGRGRATTNKRAPSGSPPLQREARTHRVEALRRSSICSRALAAAAAVVDEVKQYLAQAEPIAHDDGELVDIEIDDAFETDVEDTLTDVSTHGSDSADSEASQ